MLNRWNFLKTGFYEGINFGHCFVERGQAVLDLITRTMRKPAVNGRQVFRDELKSASLGVGQIDDDDS